MKKIKTLLLTLFLVSVSYMTEAQSIRVLYPSADNISDDALSILYNRLNQAVNQERFFFEITSQSIDESASVQW